MEDLRLAAKHYFGAGYEKYKQEADESGESMEELYIGMAKISIRKCSACRAILAGFYFCCIECEFYNGYNLCLNCFYEDVTLKHQHDSFADNHSILTMVKNGSRYPPCDIQKKPKGKGLQHPPPVQVQQTKKLDKGKGKQDSNASSDCKSIRRNIPGSADSSDYKSIRRNIPSSTDSSDYKSIRRNIPSSTDSSDCKSIRRNIPGSTDSSDCKSIRRNIPGSTDSSDCKSIRRNIPSSTDSSDCKSIRRNIPGSTDSSDCKSIRRNIPGSTDSSDCKSIRRNIPGSTDSSHSKSIIPLPNLRDSSHSNLLRCNISGSTDSSHSKPINHDSSLKGSGRHSKSTHHGSSSTDPSDSKAIIPVSNLRDSSQSNSTGLSVRKIMIDKKGIEALANVARAHYDAAPKKIRNSADEFFWSMVKQEGKTRVAMEDFVESMKEKRYPEYALPELFKMVVKDRNVGMSIMESRTIYYIVVSGRPFCSWCNCFICDVYFCCSKCSARSYALCLRCYSAKAYVNHTPHYKDADVFFLDYSVLHSTINVNVTPAASHSHREGGGSSRAIVERNPRDDRVVGALRVGQAILNVGAAVLTIASTLGACTIM
ncbi:PREDICTED: uncharacterized protein LOC109175259 isoform X1 [Ipomoea nil]|uniref:uncharacterized protein LOC109175259 isoform X1 n=1 Tax=Ipomoea nil TaxID=35883 RepID=UPI0009019981|nr:PREDICTED: uncharacterized protein LOC109175259 isoform X1 [Ipomoea nil]